MTMIDRIAALLARARVVGAWDDEDVAVAVLREMREATDAMAFAGAKRLEMEMQAPSATLMAVGWAAMIAAALGEPEPSHSSSDLGHG